MRILSQNGYQVIRTHPSFPYDIIAWIGDEHPHFVRIRRSRRPEVTRFTDEIATLAEIVRRHRVPGPVELWIYSRGGWSRYHILAGGAVPEA